MFERFVTKSETFSEDFGQKRNLVRAPTFPPFFSCRAPLTRRRIRGNSEVLNQGNFGDVVVFSRQFVRLIGCPWSMPVGIWSTDNRGSSIPKQEIAALRIQPRKRIKCARPRRKPEQLRPGRSGEYA